MMQNTEILELETNLELESQMSYVYCIRTKCKKVLYIGSSIDLKQRLKLHNYRLSNQDNRHYDLQIYQYLRDNDIFEINKLSILETYENISKLQLRIFEQQFIDCNRTEYLQNAKNAYVSEQQHKEQTKEYNKEYKQQHKEQTKEYNKQYNKKNKEHIKKQHQEYYQKNKEHIMEQKRENLNKKFVCDCGSNYTFQNKSTHNKTLKHQNWLQQD